MIHTDTLNESGFVEDTVEGLQGPHHSRLPHRGRGRRPCAGHHQGVRAARTSSRPRPIRRGPTQVNTIAEHLDMLMVCHHLPVDPRRHRLCRKPHPQGDDCGGRYFARSRRVLDHLVGQPGDGARRRSAIRTWQTAHKMKVQRGRCRGEGDNDNLRVRRYIAKYTINPAIAQGLSKHVGSIEVGKRADLVLWNPAFFGVKPDMVLVGGTIAAAPMGDPNASIPTPQPVHYRRCLALMARRRRSSVTFVSKAAMARSSAKDRRGERDGRGGKHARRHFQGVDDPQQRHAEDRCRPRDL
jgi:urease subunit alpha